MLLSKNIGYLSKPINYVDLKKAFNTVDHDILSKKMSSFGIEYSEASWFSKLDIREQCVRVNNED